MTMTPETATWDRNDDLGEHGKVTVRVRNADTATVDLYRFAAVERTRAKVHRLKSEQDHERGGNRSIQDTDGPLTGLVVDFDSRIQLVHGRPAEAPSQHVPDPVIWHLEDHGAEEVRHE